MTTLKIDIHGCIASLLIMVRGLKFWDLYLHMGSIMARSSFESILDVNAFIIFLVLHELVYEVRSERVISFVFIPSHACVHLYRKP